MPATAELEAEEQAEQAQLVAKYGAEFVNEFLAALDALTLDEHGDLVRDPLTFPTKMTTYLHRWRRSRT